MAYVEYDDLEHQRLVDQGDRYSIYKLEKPVEIESGPYITRYNYVLVCTHTRTIETYHCTIVEALKAQQFYSEELGNLLIGGINDILD
jgi:hypothetical protein